MLRGRPGDDPRPTKRRRFGGACRHGQRPSAPPAGRSPSLPVTSNGLPSFSWQTPREISAGCHAAASLRRDPQTPTSEDEGAQMNVRTSRPHPRPAGSGEHADSVDPQQAHGPSGQLQCTREDLDPGESVRSRRPPLPLPASWSRWVAGSRHRGSTAGRLVGLALVAIPPSTPGAILNRSRAFLAASWSRTAMCGRRSPCATNGQLTC
jgi:hypothetical protein